MNSKGKYIGLNQRIPFEVLDSAVDYFLEKNIIDKEYVYQKMKEFTSGPNRAKKATIYVVQILSRQKELLLKFKNTILNNSYISLNIEDRKGLCLCLISLTYPITYDLLVALSQGFKVQNQINKKFISEKVMSIYGSNRTVDIAIDALLPMIIELSTIKRDKISIYSFGTRLKIKSKTISEMIIYTDIKLSGSKSILIDDLIYKPWYAYFDISELKNDTINTFLLKKDSAVGTGYLTLKQFN